MKKHAVNNLPAPMLHTIVATQKLLVSSKKEKHAATVPPPDEATLLHLNKIAKESPFCYYYKGRANDLL